MSLFDKLITTILLISPHTAYINDFQVNHFRCAAFVIFPLLLLQHEEDKQSEKKCFINFEWLFLLSLSSFVIKAFWLSLFCLLCFSRNAEKVTKRAKSGFFKKVLEKIEKLPFSDEKKLSRPFRVKVQSEKVIENFPALSVSSTKLYSYIFFVAILSDQRISDYNLS